MYICRFKSASFVFILWMMTSFGNKFHGIIQSNADNIKVRPITRSMRVYGLKTAVDKPKPSKRDDDNYGFVDGLVKVNVFGNLHQFAYYYVYIGIGNPKVKQMLIIDTGSELVNVSCGMCTDCGKRLLPNYDILGSITHKVVECDSEYCKIVGGKCGIDNSCLFNESYSEGSNVEGKFVGDLITFDKSSDSSDLSTFFNYIGCVTKESKLIKSQITNGILGLSKSQRPTMVNHEYFESQSFIEKYLTDHFRPLRKIFSLCFSENGGVMTFGGIDEELNLKVKSDKMTWVPMIESELYIVKVPTVYLQDNKLEYDNKNFILDTGTTISTLEPKIYNDIHKSFEDICKDIIKLSKNKKTSGKCTIDKNTGKMCFTDVSKLPNITLVFENGSNFKWSPDSYTIDRSNKKTSNDYNWWCVGLEVSKTNENILGATFFKNNHIAFNLQKNSVGISRGKCPENIF